VKRDNSAKGKEPGRFLVLLTVLLVLGGLGALWGCQAKEPPLSPAAATFKRDLKGSLAELAQRLGEPVKSGDVQAIQQVLQAHTPESLKMCRLCPFAVAVLDLDGATMAVYPPQEHSKNYSQYQVVAKALREGRTGQAKLFLPDGAQLYVICTPLLEGERNHGVLVFMARAVEVQARYGISDEEFLAVDFNS